MAHRQAETRNACNDAERPYFCTAYFVLCNYSLYLDRMGEPTSGLEPLACSLRVSQWVLQGFARTCKSPIPTPVPFPCLASCCTVLRSRWCQNGVKST